MLILVFYVPFYFAFFFNFSVYIYKVIYIFKMWICYWACFFYSLISLYILQRTLHCKLKLFIISCNTFVQQHTIRDYIKRIISTAFVLYTRRYDVRSNMSTLYCNDLYRRANLIVYICYCNNVLCLLHLCHFILFFEQCTFATYTHTDTHTHIYIYNNNRSFVTTSSMP